VRARIAGIDLLTLELHAVFVARLDDEPAAARADELEDEAAEATASGPLQLAIDVDEAGAPAAAT
jgi:exoribonuclease-2